MTYRILSLDGGGIRGIYTAVLLDRLNDSVPDFYRRFDLFAGTSTGGILALGLALGLSPKDLVALYAENGARIFADTVLDDARDLGGLVGADYDTKNLKAVLISVFRQTRLEDLARRVLIPTFDLDNEARDPPKRTWKPKFFHNYPGPQSDGGELAADVALRTSAAPTFFPSYQGFIDGGVIANNPSLAALSQALDADTGKQTLSEISLLSVGTGEVLQFISGRELDWGYAQWAKPLIKILIEGSMGVAHYQCQRLLGSRYHRLSPVLPEKIELDEVRRIPDLIEFARAVPLENTIAWLKGLGAQPAVA